MSSTEDPGLADNQAKHLDEKKDISGPPSTTGEKSLDEEQNTSQQAAENDIYLSGTKLYLVTLGLCLAILLMGLVCILFFI